MESFALNWYSFVALTNKKNCHFHSNVDLTKKKFPDPVKLIGYSATGVIMVSSNCCVGPLPRTTISFSLLSICTDVLST